MNLVKLLNMIDVGHENYVGLNHLFLKSRNLL